MAKFLPGQSGNPGGRPKVAEVREQARKHTKAAIDKLAALMKEGQSEQAQIMAANSLLDRGWGRPTQPIAGDDEAPPLKIDARTTLSDAIARIVAAAAKDGSDSEPHRRSKLRPSFTIGDAMRGLINSSRPATGGFGYCSQAEASGKPGPAPKRCAPKLPQEGRE